MIHAKWSRGYPCVLALCLIGMMGTLARAQIDLGGTWTGTYTVLEDPAPTRITTSGTETPVLPPTFFDPVDFELTFGPSGAFDFGVEWTVFGVPPNTSVVYQRIQTSGVAVDETTFEWDATVMPLLSDGGRYSVATEHYVASVTINPLNTEEFLMTGLIVETALITQSPSNATSNTFIVDRTFSLTRAIPDEPPAVPIPLPPAAFTGIATLAALGALRAWNSRQRPAA